MQSKLHFETIRVSMGSETLFVCNEESVSQAELNLILSYYISRYYTLPTGRDNNPYRLALSMCGIIAGCVGWGQLKPWTLVINFFKDMGFDFNIQTLSIQQFKDMAVTDENLKLFLNQWSADSDFMLESTRLPLVISCVILLAMTKKVKFNAREWMRSRVTTFAGILEDTWTLTNCKNDGQLPQADNLQRIYVFLKAYHELRKEIFLNISKVAFSSDSLISKAFKKVYHLMRGYGLEHLILIDKYIINMHKEFMNIFLLRGFEARFGAAMQYLKNAYPKDPFYALILEKAKCPLTNPELFKEAIVVAQTIAEYYGDSFPYFYKNTSRHAEFIRENVKEYLDTKLLNK